MSNASVQVRWHDVVVEVHCNHTPFISHIREHVKPLVCSETVTEPHVTIQINWMEATDGPPVYPLLSLADAPDTRKIGKRLYRAGHRLLWTDIIRSKNIVSLFSLQGERLNVRYDHYFELPLKKLQRNPHYRYEKYFSLLKYFLYFPTIWYQEQFRHRYILHASGVAHDHTGIALGGVGGVGKTTTCIALLRRENTRLLSENLILYDAQRLYQLYEPIRLDDASVALLGDAKAVHPADFPEGTRAKQLFHVQQPYFAETVPAGVVILPEFSDTGEILPLPPEVALQRMENYNLLTREVNDYYWYAATLNLLQDTGPVLTLRRIEILRQLLRETPAYQLFIDRSAGVAPVIERICTVAVAKK